MKKILEHQVSFPVDAESDSFTAALASALVIVFGYTEETSYWCASNRRYCIHCSSCGDNLLELCTNKEVHSRLSDIFQARYIMDGKDETHGIGWKIWSALGVGPETGYAITQQSAALILQKKTQETLKRLFAQMFENDCAVWAL